MYFLNHRTPAERLRSCRGSAKKKIDFGKGGPHPRKVFEPPLYMLKDSLTLGAEGKTFPRSYFKVQSPSSYLERSEDMPEYVVLNTVT